MTLGTIEVQGQKCSHELWVRKEYLEKIVTEIIKRNDSKVIAFKRKILMRKTISSHQLKGKVVHRSLQRFQTTHGTPSRPKSKPS